MQSSWAIGLYSYSAPRPVPAVFGCFHDAVVQIFHQNGITPTYFAADGPAYSGKYTKFGGLGHKRALESGFSGLHVLSLTSNPAGSDEPGYDSVATASLAYVEEIGESLLCLAMQNRSLTFGGKAFEEVLRLLVAIGTWDFGYALVQPIEKKPEFHVLGLDGGELTQGDRRRLNSWYASLPETRMRKLRDVYPYQLLNANQLAEPISAAQSLGDFALAATQTSLQHVEGARLSLWKIAPVALDEIRESLAGTGVLTT